MNRLIDLMKKASRGAKVAIIGKYMPDTCFEVDRGTIFFRKHRESGLMTIRCDIVWFVDPPPQRVRELGEHMVCFSKSPVVLEGYPGGF